jgi:hypothetical protein
MCLADLYLKIFCSLLLSLLSCGTTHIGLVNPHIWYSGFKEAKLTLA